MKILHLICFVVFLPFWPVIFLVLLCFTVVKSFVWLYLRCKYGDSFRGMLEGTDAIFASDESKGCVMILYTLVVEESSYQPQRTASQILKSFRDKFEVAMRSGNVNLEKIFYKRQSKFGYFYWVQDEPGSVEKYIRPLDFAISDEFVSESKLQETMAKISCTNLPGENTRNVELLVGTKPFRCGEVIKFPVIFRVSHCLGDGVSMMRFLMEHLADENYFQEMMRRLIPSKNLRMRMTLFKIMHPFKVFFLMPYNILKIMLSPADKSSVHTKSLTGEKVVYWINESDFDYPLLQTVKQIRRHFPKTSFNDICNAFISKGFQAHFEAHNQSPPKYLTGMQNTKVSMEGDTLDFRNRFSTFWTKIPFEDPAAPGSSLEKFGRILTRIKKDTAATHADYQLMLNSAVANVSGLVPRFVVRYFVADFKKVTLLISALPGPDQLLTINGMELRDIDFFPQHLHGVGVAISLFTMNHRFCAVLFADKVSFGQIE